MSHNNNEHRELTAAELDLVSGGSPIYMPIEGINGSFMAPRTGETTSGGTGNNSVGFMYDLTQNRT